MNPGELIGCYQKGIYTSRELVFQVSQLVSSANVDEIMKQVPEECLGEFREWASRPWADDHVLLASIPASEVMRIEGQIKAALPVVREWFERRLQPHEAAR